MIGRAVSVAIGIAITIAAIWYLLTPEVISGFRDVAASANWPALALATLLMAGVQWLRAWRFSVMTFGTLKFPDSALVRIAFQLNFLNFTLPFRLGELGYPMMMRRAYGHPIVASLAILLLARILDLCSVGAIFLTLAAALGLFAPAIGAVPLAMLAILCAISPILLILGARMVAPRIGSSRSTVLTALQPALSQAGAQGAQLTAIGLSFVLWLVFGGIAVIAAEAVTDRVSPAVAMLGAAAGNIAFALPVNGIGGLGASQAAWALVVERAGVPFRDAAISAFALYAVTLAGALLFGGIGFLLALRSPITPRAGKPIPR